MLVGSEMKDFTAKEKTPILMLNPASSEATISRTDLETEVIKSVRYGKIEFLRIVLDSGDEQKILLIEKEFHFANLKLSLLHLEHQFLNDQKNALNEYIDKLSNGENVATLKSDLHDRIKALNNSIIEKAIKQTFDVTSQLKNKLKVLRIEEIDVYTLQAYYHNHFKQYAIITPVQSVSAILEKIRSDIASLEITIEDLTQSCHDLVYKIKNLHDDYEQFVSDRKAYFVNILSSDIRKIPFIFNFNPSDKKRIDELLLLKVSPNLVEPVTGDTLLHIAIDNNREDIVNLLLERGADLFIKNKAGISANDKASSLPNPKYLKIFSHYLNIILASNREGASLPKEIIDVIVPILNEARIVLEKYGMTLEYRKNLCLFLQFMLDYNPRIHSRSQDYAVYFEKLDMAFRDGDPHVFFNEVLKRAPSASRGVFNHSSLHDPLIELLLKFGKIFDTHAYNELKKQVKIPEIPYKEKNPTDEDIIRKLTSDLKNAHNEIELLKAKLKKVERKSNEPEKGKSHSLVRTVFC